MHKRIKMPIFEVKCRQYSKQKYLYLFYMNVDEHIIKIFKFFFAIFWVESIKEEFKNTIVFSTRNGHFGQIASMKRLNQVWKQRKHENWLEYSLNYIF